MGDPGRQDGNSARIKKGYAYLESCVHAGGGIYDDEAIASYETSLSVMAFLAARDLKYIGLIRNARKFLVHHEDKPRGLNVYGMVCRLEALYYSRDLDDGKNSVVPRKAITLILRRMAADTGLDEPVSSYLALLGYCYAGLKPDNPHVKAEFDRLQKFNSVHGDGYMATLGNRFYSELFAKTLTTYRVDRLPAANGSEMDWESDLAKRLINLQNADGSWSNEGKEPDVVLVSYNILALEILYKAM